MLCERIRRFERLPVVVPPGGRPDLGVVERADDCRFALEPGRLAEVARQDETTLGVELDLDGAREGRPANVPSIQSILEAVVVPCELGGGIRNEESIRVLLDLGLRRLVIGTSALLDPEWFRQMCRKFPNRLALGIDARGGRVATEGWQSTSDVAAAELAGWFAGEPLATLIYTDIATDGMMAGPNVAEMAAMQAAVEWPVIASGGVTTKEDVARLARVHMAGCIIGRTLYEGTLTLPEALAAAETSP